MSGGLFYPGTAELLFSIMYLKNIYLKHFRNYQEQRLEFNSKKIILLGENAQGKTNLLEAVGLLSSLKTIRARRDRDLIMHGENISQIASTIHRENAPVDLAITLRDNGRRTCTINGEGSRRQMDFIGILNIVQFSSLDLDLVRGGPEQRRNWLDELLIQLEPIYAHILQQYNKVLRQRNALLKEVKKQGQILNSQRSELALWDAQLATLGARVTVRRSRALQRLAPIAASGHYSIGGHSETLEIKYLPNVEAMQDPTVRESAQKAELAFLEKIQSRAIAEQYQGISLVGPHRDEIAFFLNRQPVRQFASHGQQRTLVLSLKLAELQLIEEVVGETPVLLLDDVLAELDPKRQQQLFQAIGDRFQTLITTTHLDHFAEQWAESAQTFTVKGGQIYA